MDKIRARELENILGIYSPFFIKDLQFSEQEENLTIYIEELQKSRSLSYRFKDTSEYTNYSWQHIKLGHCSTSINFRAKASSYDRLTRTVCPAFLGAKNKDFTQQVESLVLYGHGKNLDPEAISMLSGINTADIKSIIIANQSAEIKSSTSNLLPLETDSIWVKVIKREFQLKTNSTPLRMLLHRLELLDSNNGSNNNLQESVATLRAFFIKNKVNLSQEYQQIGAKTDQSESTKQPSNSLTPAHPVWDNILTNKITLMSSNLAFNLLISRLKNLYSDELSASEKRDIIIEMMKYLKKNIKTLRNELMSIKRIAEGLDCDLSQQDLPAKNSNIWHDILSEKVILNSKKLNLNLFMVKLKGQMSRGLEQESCEELYQFFSDNYRTLATELKIMQQENRQAV